MGGHAPDYPPPWEEEEDGGEDEDNDNDNYNVNDGYVVAKPSEMK